MSVNCAILNFPSLKRSLMLSLELSLDVHDAKQTMVSRSERIFLIIWSILLFRLRVVNIAR